MHMTDIRKISDYMPSFNNRGFQMWEYLGQSGVPQTITGAHIGDLCIDRRRGFTYQFNGIEWVSGNPSVTGRGQVEDGWSYGGDFTVVKMIEGALLNGSVNTVLSVPAGTIIKDVQVIMNDAAGTAATIDIGTGNGGWAVENNNPDCFVDGFSINATAPYRMSAIDVASQTAAAQSGAVSQADADIVLTCSTNASATPAKFVLVFTMSRVSLEIFT